MYLNMQYVKKSFQFFDELRAGKTPDYLTSDQRYFCWSLIHEKIELENQKEELKKKEEELFHREEKLKQEKKAFENEKKPGQINPSFDADGTGQNSWFPPQISP